MSCIYINTIQFILQTEDQQQDSLNHFTNMEGNLKKHEIIIYKMEI